MSNANYTKIVNTDISALSLLAAIDSDNLQNLVLQSKLSDYANVVSVSADVALDTADLMQGLLDAVYITAPAEGSAATNALSVGADTEANADALAALFNLSVNTSRVIRFINPSAIGALNTISLGNSSGTNTWVAFNNGTGNASSMTLFVPGESAQTKSVAVSVSSGGVVSFNLLNNGVGLSNIAVTESTSITAAHNGVTFNVSGIAFGAAITMTLATSTRFSGFKCRIKRLGTAGAGANFTVAAGAALLTGALLTEVQVGGGAVVQQFLPLCTTAGVAASNVIFGDTSVAHSWVLNVEYDGSNFILSGGQTDANLSDAAAALITRS